jgi:hypothetical protein
MKSYTVQEAYDVIVNKFYTGWINAGYVAKNILYDDLGDLPAADQIWSRVNYDVTDFRKRSLTSMNYGTAYERVVELNIQLFIPLVKGRLNRNLFKQNMVNIFEGGDTSLSAIWFRNIKAKNIGKDGPWYQMHLNVDIIYHEIK